MKHSPRTVLVIIAAMFLLPLLLAWFMYNGTIAFTPATTRNFGQLVEPPLPLRWQDAEIMPGGDRPPPDTGDTFGDHWVILYALPEPCPETCIQAALDLRQIHRAAGRQQSRIRIALLVQNSSPVDVVQTLQETYDRFFLIRDPSGKIRSALEQAAVGPGRVYLIDPLGNIMMTYKGGANPNDLKQDLKRLLTWSKLDEQ